MKQIYLDYAATTPVDPEVAKAMIECLTMEGNFGNPASNTHFFGWLAKEAVTEARLQVADLLGADSREIVFTSGATESNNLAIKGVADAYSHKGKHIITCVTEHKAVLDPCKYLETIGHEVTYLQPNTEGLISVAQVQDAMREDTILVSVMFVNNEIGVIQPIAEIGALCRGRKILFHVDAAQAVGKLDVDVKSMNIDLLSLSSHKLYGPKGMGALYVRRRPKIKLTPLIHGGGHEQGMRSGTLATHQIVGLGRACSVANACLSEEYQKLLSFRRYFIDSVKVIPELKINGDPKHVFPGILNVTIEGVDGEALMMALNEVAISAGSACNSATIEASYVLQAIGLTAEQAHSSFRVSFGRFTAQADVGKLIALLIKQVARLRKMSPLWRKGKGDVI